MNTLETWLSDPDAREIGRPKTTIELCDEIFAETRRIEAGAMKILAELSAETSAMKGLLR